MVGLLDIPNSKIRIQFIDSSLVRQTLVMKLTTQNYEKVKRLVDKVKGFFHGDSFIMDFLKIQSMSVAAKSGDLYYVVADNKEAKWSSVVKYDNVLARYLTLKEADELIENARIKQPEMAQISYHKYKVTVDSVYTDLQRGVSIPSHINGLIQ